MERERGKDGRFSKGSEEEPEAGRGKMSPMSASRLRHCRKLVVYKVAEAMPGIVDALVVGSGKGSFEHTKELLKLAHATQEKKTVAGTPARQESGYPRKLLEKIRKARDAKPDAAGGKLQ